MLLIAVIPPQIAMGALLFLNPQPLYVETLICRQSYALSPLADQQIGGLILWLHGAMMSVIGILILVRREWIGKR